MSALKNQDQGIIVLSQLVIRNGERSTINKDADLKKIALILGTSGIGKKKRKQYLCEQREHRSYIHNLLSKTSKT